MAITLKREDETLESFKTLNKKTLKTLNTQLQLEHWKMHFFI